MDNDPTDVTTPRYCIGRREEDDSEMKLAESQRWRPIPTEEEGTLYWSGALPQSCVRG
ncbi:uncharacterized protein CLUP02_15131 [Colletotrichum lupini]|uniref:Uncharacterized protein n=1 Tax=Colletotrichum lupini TaxID=145971 RepID=A0A9Q8WNY7_9PEZI|nr:uncharacterized protein CLUP02_15131 [Colletotrichum lupini]UQC89600.1 hypothetical protein CLUP02_15131 [Colletotrichum lupini]